MQKKETSKKGLALRIGAIAAACAVCGTAIGFGTLAKYTTSLGGTDTARVAEFNFSDTGDNRQIQEVNLFKTAYNDTVKSKDGTKVVAPGTSGSFTVDIKGDAEVDAKVTIEIAQDTDNELPLVYKIDDKYYSNLGAGTYKINDVNLGVTSVTVEGDLAKMSTDFEQTYKANTEGFTLTSDVEWYWVYENSGDILGTDEDAQLASNDAADTALGYKAADGLADDVKLTIAASVTQID